MTVHVLGTLHDNIDNRHLPVCEVHQPHQCKHIQWNEIEETLFDIALR